MQLNPRYGDDPLIRLDGAAPAIAAPLVRQRRRLCRALATLTPDRWAQPSRCEGWTVQDVIVHLDSTNAFWGYSIAAGLRGDPSRLLATFDPVASPAELVANAEQATPDQVLERFTDSTERLISAVEALDDSEWNRLAEAPPGHLGIGAVAHHALWDSWVHERDVLLPLGLVPEEEPDEVAACLRYVAALGAGFAVNEGTNERGTLTVETSDPDLAFTVKAGTHVEVCWGADTAADLHLGGPAVRLTEALSMRCPLDQPVPEDVAWLVNGLAQAFDRS